MKRVSVSYRALLQGLTDRFLLAEEERVATRRVLAEGSPAEVRDLTLRTVRELLQGGVLEVVESVAVPGGQRLRLRHPGSGFRFSIRIDEPAAAEPIAVIPLPLDPSPVPALRTALVRQLLTDQGVVVLSDRVADPREVVQRIRPALKAAVEAESVGFIPIDPPPGDYWKTGAETEPVLADSILRDLARARSYVLHVPDFARLDRTSAPRPTTGSGLYIGVGDEPGGWRAVLEIRDARAGAFSMERIGLTVLLATHFQTLIATAVRLQSLIFFDFLTGLYNRPYFEDQFEKELTVARRRDQSLSLLIVDIDDFKRFNTLYGYEGGDRVLVTVACILKSELRASDTISRYGGEEFAVLLAPPVAVEEARAIAERLRAAVEEEAFQVPTWGDDYVPERITVTVGGALFPRDGRSMREIFTASNRMLLEAKRMGKNRVRFVGDSTGEPEPA